MTEPVVWQIAAGEYGRDYSDIFLKHNVMLIGPGDAGPFEEEKYQNEWKEGWIERGAFYELRRFRNEPRPGEVVILRFRRDAVALGRIAEEGYKHNRRFDDVYGWDLQHTRRVVWQGLLKDDPIGGSIREMLFANRGYRSTFTRVGPGPIRDKILPLIKENQESVLDPVPEAPPDPLNSADIRAALSEKIHNDEIADNVAATIQRQKKLTEWYFKKWREMLKQHGRAAGHWYRPSEYEVIAHMVVPLLFALGWPPERLAVEWQRFDLVLFDGEPTTPENCVLACEAKGLGLGLQKAREQATHNVKRLNLSRCNKVVTTDGKRIYLYERRDGEFGSQPSGYVNICKVRTNHVAPAGTNAIDTLVALTPGRISEPLRRSG